MPCPPPAKAYLAVNQLILPDTHPIHRHTASPAAPFAHATHQPPRYGAAIPAPFLPLRNPSSPPRRPWIILPRMTSSPELQARYWDDLAEDYQSTTQISTHDFHYGPLLPGDSTLRLLPPRLAGLRCLDAGCGGGQNSIYLAQREAHCVCVDASRAQLAHAERCAAEHGVSLTTCRGPLEALPAAAAGPFDLVFSIYTLPFVRTPAQVVASLAERLARNGTLLLSTAHPLAHTEWVELPGEGMVALVSDYFHPPGETRPCAGSAVEARTYPVSEVAGWVTDAGLRIDSLLEPQALPAEHRNTPPYTSPAWATHRQRLRHVPVALIVRATRP